MGDRHLPAARRRTLTWLIVAAFVGALALALLTGLAGLIAGAVVAWIGLAFYARPGAREHAALPSLGEGTFPVTIEIRLRGRRLGKENGWVAFADGWLVYDGLRTSFSVRTSDVGPTYYDLAGRLLLRTPEGLTVRLGLLTDIMQTHRPGRFRDSVLLQEAFDEWQKLPAPAGAAVLPPRELSPRMAGEIAGERIVFATIATLLAAFALAWEEFTWAAVGFVVALGLVFDVIRRARSLRRQLALSPETDRTGCD